MSIACGTGDRSFEVSGVALLDPFTPGYRVKGSIDGKAIDFSVGETCRIEGKEPAKLVCEYAGASVEITLTFLQKKDVSFMGTYFDWTTEGVARVRANGLETEVKCSTDFWTTHEVDEKPVCALMKDWPGFTDNDFRYFYKPAWAMIYNVGYLQWWQLGGQMFEIVVAPLAKHLAKDEYLVLDFFDCRNNATLSIAKGPAGDGASLYRKVYTQPLSPIGVNVALIIEKALKDPVLAQYLETLHTYGTEKVRFVYRVNEGAARLIALP
jgi:hypothetical protein